MFNVRPWLLAGLIFAACGGREIGGSDGIGGGGGSGTAGSGGNSSSAVTTGPSTGTAITTTSGVTTGSSGPTTTTTTTTTGGFAGAGGAGGITPCGPISCGPGLSCCNASCGICVTQGQACPAIGCGTGGSTGAGGSSPCGTYEQCVTRLPGNCSPRSGCLCSACLCQTNACENDSGCQQILGCAFKMNCGGTGCYTPQTCQAIIDHYGLNSRSFQLALQVEQCSQRAACPRCGVAVDAGPACVFPPPPAGGVSSCSGSGSPDGFECSQVCTDGAMNSYVAKCSNGICNCFYDGRQTCTCSSTVPFGMCGSCCPPWAPIR